MKGKYKQMIQQASLELELTQGEQQGFKYSATPDTYCFVYHETKTNDSGRDYDWLSTVILYYMLLLPIIFGCIGILLWYFLSFTWSSKLFWGWCKSAGSLRGVRPTEAEKNGPRSTEVKWDRNSPGRDWKGEKLIWQLFLLTLLMFPLRTKLHQRPPHHHHHSKKKKKSPPAFFFFCSATLPPLSKSTSPNTPSLPVEHVDPKPNFLSPGHFLLCNTQSQVCFSRGVGNREGCHSTWRKWGPCQCIFMTCQSEAQWGSGGCLEWNERCWWPYSLQSPLGICLASTATLS